MARRTSVTHPLARSEGLLVEEIGSERVVYDTQSKEAHCLSPLAAAIFAHADGRTDVEGLAEITSFATGDVVTTETVDAALLQLADCGLLDSSLTTTRTGMSRRTMIQRTAGATAALTAVPLVTSVVTPAFAQGTPNLSCPGALCASESAGDDFCACVNGCPGADDDRCEHLANGGPYLDSCECLNCQQLTDAGRADLCPPTPYQQCPPTSSPTNPGPGGCIDPNKFLDGRCLKEGGDSSEPCPTL